MIDYITGTSIGSIIDAQYTIGYSIDEIDSMPYGQKCVLQGLAESGALPYNPLP